MNPPLPEREEIALLEPFEGLGLQAIRVVDTPEAAQHAATEMLAIGMVGFDTESKPTFAKNEVSGGPHVLQFAALDQAWLFQLHRTECHEILASFLHSAELIKVGFGLATDLSSDSPALRCRAAGGLRRRHRVPAHGATANRSA